MIRIADYTAEYQDKVIDLILTIQQQEFNIPITLHEQPDLTDIESFYQMKGSFWVALDGDDVVGSVAVKDIGNGDAVLRKMFVRRDFRGSDKGVSGKLLRRLLEWVAVEQYNAVYLGTTEQFTAAHRFYEKNGFIEIEAKDLPETFPVMHVDKKFYRLALH